MREHLLPHSAGVADAETRSTSSRDDRQPKPYARLPPGALDARGTSGGRCDCEFEFRRVKEADRGNRRLP